jgi:peptidoglycan/LPS O-acetylase OafA/YrhL
MGVLAGRAGLSRLTASRAVPWICALGLTTGVAILSFGDPMPPTSWLGTRTTSGVALGVVTSVALCAGVLALSGLLSRTRAVRPLSVLGERSLDIFLAHILAITAVRAALEGLGIENVAMHLAIGTAVGLALPLGIWWLGRRVGFPWLFASPLK